MGYSCPRSKRWPFDTVWALLRTQICCSFRFSARLDYIFSRIWCNNDSIGKCQWVQCITLFITIFCDIVNKSGQAKLVLRHAWLWVVFNDAISSRDCVVLNGGMINYFERMWKIAVVGLICGTIPAFAWMTCCQPRKSCQDILSVLIPFNLVSSAILSEEYELYSSLRIFFILLLLPALRCSYMWTWGNVVHTVTRLMDWTNEVSFLKYPHRFREATHFPWG